MPLSHIGHTQDETYLPLLQDVQFLPIFILGDHRSGTTLLYKLLASTESFNFVTAYHLIRYDEILFNYVNRTENNAREALDELFKSLGLRDRIVDGVAVTPDLPEEYGFILRNAGYRPQLDPVKLPGFIELCKKIQFVSVPGRPLLLKNPWDFLNFMYVKAALPETKFIFIHRHPIHVINSQLRATRSLLTSKNAYVALIAQWYTQLFDRPVHLFVARLLFSSHFDLGLRIVTRHVVRAATYFLRHVGSLPVADYISVRYEDLCEDPETSVLRILKLLGLKQKSSLVYDTFIEPRPLRLLPEVARKYDGLRQRLQPYCAYHGYDGQCSHSGGNGLGHPEPVGCDR
jgi:hypothetical protein